MTTGAFTSNTQGSVFTYGENGNADFQLQSLATRSHSALQTLEFDCKEGRSADKPIGYSGVEIPLKESFQNLLLTVDVEHNCKGVKLCITYQFLCEEEMLNKGSMHTT